MVLPSWYWFACAFCILANGYVIYTNIQHGKIPAGNMAAIAFLIWAMVRLRSSRVKKLDYPQESDLNQPLN